MALEKRQIGQLPSGAIQASDSVAPKVVFLANSTQIFRNVARISTQIYWCR